MADNLTDVMRLASKLKKKDDTRSGSAGEVTIPMSETKHISVYMSGKKPKVSVDVLKNGERQGALSMVYELKEFKDIMNLRNKIRSQVTELKGGRAEKDSTNVYKYRAIDLSPEESADDEEEEEEEEEEWTFSKREAEETRVKNEATHLEKKLVPKPSNADIRDAAHAHLAELWIHSMFGGDKFGEDCPGCTPVKQPNQEAHFGGCLSNESEADREDAVNDITTFDIAALYEDMLEEMELNRRDHPVSYLRLIIIIISDKYTYNHIQI